MKIGFIGTGVMGTGMVLNLIKHHYDVTVYNRTKAHAADAMNAGAKWADSPKELAAEVDVVLTIVGFPQDVEEVYYGDNGLFQSAKAGQTLIEMTTSKPSLEVQIAETADAKGIKTLDAPVSGGDVGAKNGTLTIMVGGEQAVFDEMKPVLSAMGSNVNLFGGHGKGQHTKMANQIMIAGTMTGLSEMLAYGKSAGLDLSALVKTVSQGSGDNWSLDNYGPRILAGDFKPGFAAKHFLKDLRIALQESEKMDVPLPATEKAKELYEKMVDQMNLGNDGTQGLVKLYEK
ncbi:NAD(P)-dependent oxidoreductase [Lactobacillus sp. Sy-1]|uniref:NAD(P)-dependent oxidoreductase n=1 Tax=Lactobacillus sp. Sy-1 TaxID=2109645 RepID=UPI001C578528|nr:NAD(P)-dependent oxidoreductase [Lactobacillus sp. Sy-1]MBW1605063.1 NAD(P)-dependent oxidoreductase [Lactobacillus sp. Sy-1]